MRTRLKALAMSTLACLLFAPPLCAQTVTNVRARQLTDGTKRVEILYDLSGAAAGGAVVTVAISGDGGATYAIAPVPGSLAGDVAGVANGADRRILWDPATSVPVGTYGTNYRVAVTAINPSSVGREITYTLPGGVPLVLVRIPAGTFQMGAPESERGSLERERPVHQVTLTSDYYLGKYEVTQAQWQAVMGTNPSYFGSCGGGCPVERTSWDSIRGANGFIEKLNQLLGTTKFRLPTEAEWERAARGGTQTRFSFGDALDENDLCSWSNGVSDPWVWSCHNADGRTHGVGLKGANPFGLHDMHGNVREWVEDWYEEFAGQPLTDPLGPTVGSTRITRGGSFTLAFVASRSAGRLYTQYPGLIDYDLGFRLAKSP
ncbi:MAG: formylglycine-generating enzyme family protein [Thermoanaerobaculia bacterium]